MSGSAVALDGITVAGAVTWSRRLWDRAAEMVAGAPSPARDLVDEAYEQARVTARRRGGLVVLEVRDDGIGGADPARGSGLVGLADRVSVLHGRITMSSPSGGPTVIGVELPCA